MKSGRVYKQFTAKNRKLVTLRSLRWEDLDQALESAEELFQEWETDPKFGVPMSKKPTLETEARWLADNLVKIETGKQISVAAEIDGKLAGNCLVDRSENSILEHYGRLGIAVSKEFRNIGLGYEIMKTALDECRKAGVTLIDLEVFANNERAIHLYEKVGFREAGRTPKKINRNGQFEDDILMVIQL
jgi:ribosomal protein S18 acetylase RimI-like enzyme